MDADADADAAAASSIGHVDADAGAGSSIGPHAGEASFSGSDFKSGICCAAGTDAAFVIAPDPVSLHRAASTRALSCTDSTGCASNLLTKLPT